MATGKCTDVFRGIFLFRGRFEGGLHGRIFPWRNWSWGKTISMKRAQDFLALFEKTMKN